MGKNLMDKTAFFGKVTASVSHELQNVLAIIRESSGLMEDILLMDKGHDSELAERLHKSLATIKKQVNRGVGLTSGLNHFAHTTDHAESQVNTIGIIKKLISLTGRLTELKGVEVSVLDCDKPPSILADPVFFQQVTLLCIDCLADIVPAGTKLLISVAEKAVVSIEFTCHNTILEFSDFHSSIIRSSKWSEIIDVCKHINLVAELTEESPGITLTFRS